MRIREATRDGARAYGISAVVECAGSGFYPTNEEKTNCLRSSGSHTDIFLEKFKQFLQRSIQSDKAFKYRSRMFLFYGPLMELFDFVTHYRCGQAREVCYILQLPMYAQLNFRNYYVVFVHLINLLGKWPLAFCRLLANNCLVNMLGKSGSAIEHDAFVEAEIVQPLKNYVSGKEFHSFMAKNDERLAHISVLVLCVQQTILL